MNTLEQPDKSLLLNQLKIERSAVPQQASRRLWPWVSVLAIAILGALSYWWLRPVGIPISVATATVYASDRHYDTP